MQKLDLLAGSIVNLKNAQLKLRILFLNVFARFSLKAAWVIVITGDLLDSPKQNNFLCFTSRLFSSSVLRVQ